MEKNGSRITILPYDHQYRGIRKKAVEMGILIRHLSPAWSTGTSKVIWSQKLNHDDCHNGSQVQVLAVKSASCGPENSDPPNLLRYNADPGAFPESFRSERSAGMICSSPFFDT